MTFFFFFLNPMLRRLIFKSLGITPCGNSNQRGEALFFYEALFFGSLFFQESALLHSRSLQHLPDRRLWDVAVGGGAAAPAGRETRALDPAPDLDRVWPPSPSPAAGGL